MAITVSQRAREYVRKRAQDHMIATVTLYRPVDVTFNDTTGIVGTPSRASYYTGKCRIWSLNTGSSVIIGETDIAVSDTIISIPFGSPAPKIDDMAVVGINPPDPTLNSMAFIVQHFDGGGLIGGTIRMNCKALADSADWQNG